MNNHLDVRDKGSTNDNAKEVWAHGYSVMQRLLLQLCPGKASFEQLQGRVACAHFLGGSCSLVMIQMP
jgi:hypothetical protein